MAKKKWKDLTTKEKIIGSSLLLVFILLIANASVNSKKSNLVESKRDINTANVKVTLKDAVVFMQKRCKTINQKLMEKKTVNFDGTKLYMFMSVDVNGYVCISTISENALEILAADCGPSERKIQEWNSVNGIEEAISNSEDDAVNYDVTPTDKVNPKPTEYAPTDSELEMDEKVISFKGYITSFNSFEMEPCIFVRITSGPLSGQTISNVYDSYDEFYKILSDKLKDTGSWGPDEDGLNIKVKGNIKDGECLNYNDEGEMVSINCKRFSRIELD